jgi:3-methyl-2-oxobutanoate hydroxymethyltransferase
MSFYITPQQQLLTLVDLQAMKQRGEKIACLTAYDASFSALIDAAGIDVILVGDSLGMVIQGRDSTLPVSVADMVYHARCVSSARQRALVIADMPFMSYATPDITAASAAALMQQGGAQMVKLEGMHAEAISLLVKQGVPICGHLGLLPQSINQLGGYKVQGREQSAAEKIFREAQQLEQAGVSLLVLECVPAALAECISRQLRIPVIGIGAGAGCDGQVMVLYDILDIGGGKRPRFVKNFLQQAGSIRAAIGQYISDVKSGAFPSAEQSY